MSAKALMDHGFPAPTEEAVKKTIGLTLEDSLQVLTDGQCTGDDVPRGADFAGPCIIRTLRRAPDCLMASFRCRKSSKNRGHPSGGRQQQRPARPRTAAGRSFIDTTGGPPVKCERCHIQKAGSEFVLSACAVFFSMRCRRSHCRWRYANRPYFRMAISGQKDAGPAMATEKRPRVPRWLRLITLRTRWICCRCWDLEPTHGSGDAPEFLRRTAAQSAGGQVALPSIADANFQFNKSCA